MELKLTLYNYIIKSGNTTAAVGVTKLLYKLYPYYKLPIKSSFFNMEQMQKTKVTPHFNLKLKPYKYY